MGSLVRANATAAQPIRISDAHSCGSLLFSVVRDGKYVHIAMGSLVDPPTIRPTEHIYVGSKAPWYEITDSLPQHDELG